VLDFFADIFYTLGRHDNHVFIVAVYLTFSGLIIFLRVAAHLHFRGVLLGFRFEAKKELKDKADVGKISHSLLKKVAVEYIRVAERAVTQISTGQLVERAVGGMGFLGWKYSGLLPFIEAFEYGLLGIGLILAVIFGEYAAAYGLLAIVVFAAFRVAAGFFNVRSLRADLVGDVILFLERELGRFFVADEGGAILRLKNDLTEAINRQSEVFRATVSEVSVAMIGAANSIGPIVAAAMDEKLINMNETLTHTLRDWEDVLKRAAVVHAAINDSAEKFGQSGERIRSASDLLAGHMQGHSSALSEQLITLVSAIDEMKSGIKILGESQAALTKQATFIERNQKALETSLHAYEDSLKALTQSVGDGLGAFINLHAETAAQTINDAMKNNISQIMNLPKL
jgi:hypothetical protein